MSYFQKISLLIVLQIGSYHLVSAQSQIINSEVEFTIKNAGINVDGSFQGLEGSFNFDPNNLSTSEVYASLDASTIETGIKARDRHLKDKKYFHVEEFPQISIKSKSFRKDGNSFIGIFTLNLKGTAKDIEISFTEEKVGNNQKMQGSFELNRLDFGIGKKNWILSNTVKINVSVELKLN